MENEKLKELNSRLINENLYLKNKIQILEIEKRTQMRSFFDDTSLDIIFKDADSDTRKKRFKKLSHIFHPDSEVGDAEIFNIIKDAYEKLEAS